MSRSYIARDRDGGTLYLIGRGKAAAPEGAIDRHQAAVLLSVDADQVEGEIMSLRTNLEADCRTARVGDEFVFHGDDVRELARRKMRGEHRRRRQSSDPFRPRPERSRERFEFSAPPPQSRQNKAAGVTIAKAAGQAGMSEEEMTTRILGKARLKVIDGDLVVSVADLNRLAADGLIPKPGDRAKLDAQIADIEGKPSRDAAVDRRTEQMADSLGVDLGSPSKPGSSAVDRRAAAVAELIGVELDAPSKRDDDQGREQPKRVPGFTTARADDRPTYRLGAPRRWGQR